MMFWNVANTSGTRGAVARAICAAAATYGSSQQCTRSHGSSSIFDSALPYSIVCTGRLKCTGTGTTRHDSSERASVTCHSGAGLPNNFASGPSGRSTSGRSNVVVSALIVTARY